MSTPAAESTRDEHGDFRLLQFRLVHIVYVVTLLASSLATFGAPGLMLGILVCVFWAAVFTSPARPKTLVTGCLVVLIGICLAGLLLPPPRGPSRRTHCQNKLRQIALALSGYELGYGSFPPAYIADENGKPMHSWRVLLLPYLDEQPLYDKYDFNEPWNGPNNSKLINSMPEIYSCPSTTGKQKSKNTYTSYLAVVGPNTMWPGASSRSAAEITDGAANTVLVIEYDDQQIAWSEPRDLKFDEALQVLASEDGMTSVGHKRETFLYQYSDGRCVAFADGRVGFVGNIIVPLVWSALLQVNEGISWDQYNLKANRVARRPKLDNWIRLGIFILLTLFPLPWVWLNP